MKKILILSLSIITLGFITQSTMSMSYNNLAIQDWIQKHKAQNSKQIQGGTLAGLAGGLGSTIHFLRKVMSQNHTPGNIRRFFAMPIVSIVSMQLGVEGTRFFESAGKASESKDVSEESQVCTGKPSCKMGC
jgi:hypothetical protein